MNIRSFKIHNTLDRCIEIFSESNIILESIDKNWFNIKVDNLTNKKIANLSKVLNNGETHEDFVKRLRIISNPLKRIPNNVPNSLEKRLTSAIILQYLREIKDFHEPSSAGFLLEEIICGLMFGEMGKKYDHQCDTTSISGESYQLKFYTEGRTIYFKKSQSTNNLECDHLIISFKFDNQIGIYIITNPEDMCNNNIRRLNGVFREVNNRISLSPKNLKEKYEELVLKQINKKVSYDGGYIEYIKIDLSYIEFILSRPEYKNINKLYRELNLLSDATNTLLRGEKSNKFINWERNHLFDTVEKKCDLIKMLISSIRTNN